MSIQSLRERRAELSKQARNLTEQHQATWNAAHTAEFDSLMEQVSNIDDQIKRTERAMSLDADRALADAGVREGGPAAASVRSRAFATLLRSGEQALSAEERRAIANTMSTTTGSEGGFTVQTDVATALVEALKAYGGMREVAQLIRTEKGNPLNYPTTDGTAEVGEIVAENGSATDADPVFGTVSLNPFKYSSKVITVPIELLQDSSVDIEALVMRRLAERIGRITNAHFTTGTGTGQPRGVATAATVGKAGTTGQTLTVTYDDLVDLQHSVNRAYRGNARWMFADTSLRVIRKLKDLEGRPIFVPGYEVGNPAGDPDRLLGAPIVINDDVAAMAANAKSILFGDFNYYLIRDVLDLTILRFTDSAYAKKGQVGFLGWHRASGNFIDASGGAVKAYQNSAT
jgi:HK97 family phage major capsid protein